MKNNPRILIVDDDLYILKIIRRLLSRYQMDLYATSDPNEVLDIIKENQIDLIICDQRMPEMDGILLLSMVKEISPDTIRILMSGYTDVNILVEAINSGCIYQYIPKPWENDNFIRTVFKALEVQIEDIEQKKILKSLLNNRKWIDTLSQTKQSQRNDFLNHIIKDQIIITDIIKDKAKLLDIEVTKPYYMCMISVNNNLPVVQLERILNEPPNLNELNFIFNMLPNCIAWNNGKFICLIVISELPELNNIIQVIIKDIRELLANYSVDSFSIGISNICNGLGELRKGYNQAYDAYIVADSSLAVSCVTYYEDIGVFQLLTKLRDRTETKEYIENTLGELIQYDKEKGGELLHTLEVLLTCNNLKEAALKLYIHPKTMIFRKKRIEKILHITLDDYETRLSLGIALKLHKLE